MRNHSAVAWLHTTDLYQRNMIISLFLFSILKHNSDKNQSFRIYKNTYKRGFFIHFFGIIFIMFLDHSIERQLPLALTLPPTLTHAQCCTPTPQLLLCISSHSNLPDDYILPLTPPLPALPVRYSQDVSELDRGRTPSSFQVRTEANSEANQQVWHSSCGCLVQLWD